MSKGSRWRPLWAVVAIGAVVAFLPLGVQAAMQLVVIKDPQTNSKARVTNGRLRVGDQGGPLTVEGTVVPQTETTLIETAGHAPLPDPTIVPFDASPYGQLRLAILNHTTSTGSVDWTLQHTTPVLIRIASGTVSVDDGTSVTIGTVPGTGMRLVLEPSDSTTDVTYAIFGR